MTDMIRSGPVVVVLSFFLAGSLAVSESSRGTTSRRSAFEASGELKPASDLAYAPADEGDVEVDEDLSDLVVPRYFEGLKRQTDWNTRRNCGPAGGGFKRRRRSEQPKHLDSPTGSWLTTRASYAYALVLLPQKRGSAFDSRPARGETEKVPLPGLAGSPGWLSRGGHAKP
jgi:hypothetical protein